MYQNIDLVNYKEDTHHFGPLSLILTVKSFDLQAIRARYIASRAQNTSGRAGSVERRQPATGGVISLNLVDGAIREQRILCRQKEPRAIDLDLQRFAFAAEDVVHVFAHNKYYRIVHPWFSYIHTVAFSPHHPERILIASSGLDILMEWDYVENKPCWEWLAWEHGFDTARDPKTNEPVLLTRSAEQAKNWEKAEKNYRLITDPKQQHLPTAQRAAFINSVTYDPDEPEHILATFFHEGKVYRIHIKTGLAEPVLDNLKNPHGGRTYGDNYMATSTGSGEVVTGNIKDQVRYRFHGLPGKAAGLENMEWIQNSIILDRGFLSIDSNRNAFVLFDPVAEVRTVIPYNDNWAVQDTVQGKLPAGIRTELADLDDPPDQLK